jgi:hypothetical protein
MRELRLLGRATLVLAGLSLIVTGSTAEATAARKAPRRGRAARVKAHAGATATMAARSGLPAGAVSLQIEPAAAVLNGRRAVQHLVVTAVLKDGGTADVTDRVTFVPGNGKLVKVAGGTVFPLADGQSCIKAKLGPLVSPSVAITVQGAAAPAHVQFANDVMPILAKAGCNSTACHGSPAGKAGFKLSLFGYEPALDYAAIVTGTGGRRVNLKDPRHSLILLKPTLAVSHGGGQRFKVDSPEYKTLLAWLTAGAPGISDADARVQQVTVTPAEPWMPAPGARQRLVVSATLSDGAVQDVTDKALFSTNDDGIAAVDDRGIVTARRPGETAIMVRYLGQVAVSRIAVLPPWKLPPLASLRSCPRLAQYNVIDTLVQSKLRKLRVLPSGLCTDEEFIRRATLDTCGIIPTVEEVRTFVADKAPDKRTRLVNRLLERPEFVDLWTLKWNDTLRNNPQLTRLGLLPYSHWIRDQIRQNRPFDQFVRDLLTASGKNAEIHLDPDNLPARLQQMAKLKAEKLQQAGKQPEAAKLPPGAKPGAAERLANLVELINNAPFNPAVNYFAVTRDPLDLTSATSQIFLGVRIECARCHNHPFEKWTQSDYYHLAAFFSGINVRGNNQTPQLVTVNRRAALRDPNTNQVVEPQTLDGTPVSTPLGGDKRAALADWITSPTNPFFAQATVNRLWEHYFGRGIVEPVDDFRVTNPPSNPELLQALAKELVDHHYDLKGIHRLILNSRTYQQSSVPNQYNRQDTSNFARFYPKRMMAEQLYDSISQATGVFLSLNQPAGRRRGMLNLAVYGQDLASEGPITRVMQLPALPQARRGRVGELKEFLDTFGKPRREVVCACERSTDGNVGQALALINGSEINDKLTAPEGRLQRLIREQKPDVEVIDELYLAALSRRPTAEERKDAAALIHQGKTRAEGIQDLLWALLNSREFLFVH